MLCVCVFIALSISHCSSSGAFHASHYYQTLNGREPRHFSSDAEEQQARACVLLHDSTRACVLRQRQNATVLSGSVLVSRTDTEG